MKIEEDHKQNGEQFVLTVLSRENGVQGLTFQKLVAGIAALPGGLKSKLGGLKSKLGGLGSNSPCKMSRNVIIYFMFSNKFFI